MTYIGIKLEDAVFEFERDSSEFDNGITFLELTLEQGIMCRCFRLLFLVNENIKNQIDEGDLLFLKIKIGKDKFWGPYKVTLPISSYYEPEYYEDEDVYGVIVDYNTDNNVDAIMWYIYDAYKNNRYIPVSFTPYFKQEKQ